MKLEEQMQWCIEMLDTREVAILYNQMTLIDGEGEEFITVLDKYGKRKIGAERYIQLEGKLIRKLDAMYRDYDGMRRGIMFFMSYFCNNRKIGVAIRQLIFSLK